MRIGYGYDVHRLKAGRPCILCGVEVPHTSGPDGHSDGDVPAHALTDALLGALALGDIGRHFPPTEEKWRDANSITLLKAVYQMVLDRGYVLGNLDITIILERPRLAPYIEAMRSVLASALSVDPSQVSVKATTEEKLGFTGAELGIAAAAVVLLMPRL